MKIPKVEVGVHTLLDRHGNEIKCMIEKHGDDFLMTCHNGIRVIFPLFPTDPEWWARVQKNVGQIAYAAQVRLQSEGKI